MNDLSKPCRFSLPLGFMHGTPIGETKDKINLISPSDAMGSLGFSWLASNYSAPPKYNNYPLSPASFFAARYAS